MQLPRSSGILLHPTSLPSGRLDADAYAFVDWLADAGQSWWQVLPLGPPDEFGSPYRARSAFAGSRHLLADPKAPVSEAEVEELVARQAYWIGGWARFAGAAGSVGGKAPDARPTAGGALADQVRFEREWQALRAYAHERGVRLIGDVPIYVADVGADVETWPELFAHGAVAGAPPDSLSASGQLWGNPLYDWPVHRAGGYRWWVERFRRTFELVDLARIDHFRGFVSYWAVPERHKTARRGHWQRGPGRELFDAVGDLPLIAEDLGVITPAVYRLRDELGLPGMAVLIWAFGGGRNNLHAPRNIRIRQVAYTTTHDTDTAAGWFEKLSKRKQRETGLDPAEPHWGLIELALQSRASLAVVPAQDVLGLGSEAQMNRPGTAEGNWRWKLKRGQLTRELARRLRDAATAAGRVGP